MPGHVGQNPEAALGVLEVTILDSGLDHIERSRHDQRGGCAGNGRYEVLEPRSLVVVLELEQVLLGEGGSSKQLPKYH